ncbi:MAG TPA: HTTM domain-containing protein [Polyangiaceae bacterium]|nr:HTTM domain-containing protein [Polyangiaceae bacterium]
MRASNVVGDFVQARYFTADARFLGAFRIGFGALLTWDGARRFDEAREYYSNEGFLPNHFSLFRPMGDGVFSFLHAFSSLAEVRSVMALMLVVFVMYTVGYRTKLAQVLAFLAITSLDARDLFVENGGDVLVNVMAFFTITLPLGRRFSVDALLRSMRERHEKSPEALNDRSRPAPPDNAVVSLMVVLLFLQLAVIYFFNAVHKSGEGWKNGSAIWWFLQQDRIVTHLGIFLREHLPYPLIRGSGYGALGMEFSLPWILLFPFYRTWAMRLALLLGVGLHGGIALTSRLGPFSYAMMLFYVLFLGAADAALFGRWFGREARRRTVIFDVDCGICLLICRVLKRLDPWERLTFLGNDRPEAFPPGVEPGLAERSVVVVDPNGKVHAEERAVLEIGRALPFGIVLLGWLAVPGLNALGRAGYRLVATNRVAISSFLGLGACGLGRPGETPEAALPDERPQTWRATKSNLTNLAREALVAVVLVGAVIQVANDNQFVNRRVRVRRPDWVVAPVNTFRLLEGWGMFAPEPPYDDGHVVVDARTKDGRKLDPFTGKLPDFDPYTTTGWGHEQFWCDYNNRIRFDWHQPNRQHLREYLKHWHEYYGKPSDELVAFDVWWVGDKSPPPGKERGEAEAPQKLLSYGSLSDSLAEPWLHPKAGRLK